MAANQSMEVGPNFKDISGMRFGRLLALQFAGRNERGHILWKCACDCGNEVLKCGQALRNGSTRSCGCFQRQLAFDRHRIHGEAGSPEHMVWVSMIQRCINPSHRYWHLYGGRGITVCKQWRGPMGFQTFLRDMGHRPSQSHSIDRFPDNNGPYSPENCRWATRIEQARNRSTNCLITFRGHTLTIQEWSERSGIHKSVIQWRFRHGWSPQRTLTTPVRGIVPTTILQAE